MIFSSYTFVLGFLPITLLSYYFVSMRAGARPALAVLVGASWVFYGWWNAYYTGLFLLTILFNFGVGAALRQETASPSIRRSLLTAGIIGNLGTLGFYKYAGFLVENLNLTLGLDASVPSIALPLAISFFTFQQIAYIVDSYHKLTTERSFLSYLLFISFFPQLIAGPIVHHKEMMPQFRRLAAHRLTAQNFAIGLTIFSIGLFKKLIIADNVSTISDDIFTLAALNQVSFLEAWLAALAYTVQIYFDFSAYSDMATGLARMFGIRLPVNFLSPYKATSIIDFWRRWHITLSRFLRDYLYIPLGGSRSGHGQRVVNIMIVMVIGGLWHGAAWTFVAWGALHGFFLVVNHTWRIVTAHASPSRFPWLGRFLGWGLTFYCVVIAWIFFRAPSFEVATNMLHGMAGLNGIILPGGFESKLTALGISLQGVGITFGTPGQFTKSGAVITLLALAFAWVLPNTYEITRAYKPILRSAETLNKISFLARFIQWQPTVPWGLFIAVLLVCSLVSMGAYKEFLYFNF